MSLFGVWRELCLSARTLLSHPAFAFIVILTLAVGIGLNAATFTVADTVMIRSLPYKNPKELVEIQGYSAQTGRVVSRMPIEQALVWREQAAALFPVAVYAQVAMVRTEGMEPEAFSVVAVSSNLLSMLGTAPLRGRTFAPEDSTPGAPMVAVLSYKAWNDSFGKDTEVVGEIIELDNNPCTVIGVMPPNFLFPAAGMVDMWVPLARDGTVAGARVHSGQLIARVVNGLSVDQAQERLDGVAAGLEETQPRQFGWSVRLESHSAISISRDSQQALWMLMIASVLILLVATLSYINLTLARTTARSNEMAVRIALGASFLHLARPLVVETILLASAAAVFALASVRVALPLLIRQVPGELTFFAKTDIVVDSRILVYTLTIAAVIAVVSGVIPARRVFRPGPTSLAWNPSEVTSRSKIHRLRSIFIVAQVTLSVALLMGATLLTRSFVELTRVDPGFKPQNLAFLTISLSAARYPQGAQRYTFFAELRERIASLPGIKAVALFSGVPPGAGLVHFGARLEAEGVPLPAEQPFWLPSSHIDSNFLGVMGVYVLAGRNFNLDEAPDSAIIDEPLSVFLFGNDRPIGRRFRIDHQPWLKVVGVIADLKLTGQDDRNGRFDILHPLARGQSDELLSLAIRTQADPVLLFPAIREAAHSIDPLQPIWKLQTASDALMESLEMPQFLLILMTTFSCAALVLACTGLYGVLSLTVRERYRELGIRLAVGASPRDLYCMIIKDGLSLVGLGMILGIGCSLGVARFIRAQLFEIHPADPLTIVGVSLMTEAVAIAASVIPARSAARVEPQVALRTT